MSLEHINKAFPAEPKNDEPSCNDKRPLCSDGSKDANRALGNGSKTTRPPQRLEVADAVNNARILFWRMKFALIAAFALSLLVWLATLGLTITIWMSVRDRTEGACKVKGDFK